MKVKFDYEKWIVSLRKRFNDDNRRVLDDCLAEQGLMVKDDKFVPFEVVPIFRDGDFVRMKDDNSCCHEIIQVDWLDKKYRCNDGGVIHFAHQDWFEKYSPTFVKGRWYTCIRNYELYGELCFCKNKAYYCEKDDFLKGERDTNYRLVGLSACFREWSVSDICCGDVVSGLQDEYERPWIGIYKEKDSDSTFSTFCFLAGGTHDFVYEEDRVHFHTLRGVKPANKEEKKILEDVMQKEGFIFDRYNKKLLRAEMKAPKWKRIKKGERLPCNAFMKTDDGIIMNTVMSAGVIIGSDAWYMSIKEIGNLDYESE